MELPLYKYKEMVTYANDKETDKTAWEMWIQLYPLMATGQIKLFNFIDFKKEIINHATTEIKTNEEIEKEILPLVADYKKQRGLN